LGKSSRQLLAKSKKPRPKLFLNLGIASGCHSAFFEEKGEKVSLFPKTFVNLGKASSRNSTVLFEGREKQLLPTNWRSGQDLRKPLGLIREDEAKSPSFQKFGQSLRPPLGFWELRERQSSRFSII